MLGLSTIATLNSHAYIPILYPYLSTYILYTYLPIYLSTYLSIYLYLYIYLSIYLATYHTCLPNLFDPVQCITPEGDDPSLPA